MMFNLNLNFEKNKSLIKNSLALLAMMLFAQSGFAEALTDDDAFRPFYDFIVLNLNGGLGVGLALLAFLISVVVAAVSQTGMPIVIGVVIAVAMSFGPGLIENLVTGGSMLPVDMIIDSSLLTEG